MTVNRTATQAGKRYEKEILDYLREKGLDVERLRLSGSQDEGDLAVRQRGFWVIEAKRTRGLDLAGWVKEAQVERDNFALHRGIMQGHVLYPRCMVVHKAKGKGVGQSYVTTTLEEWLRQL